MNRLNPTATTSDFYNQISDSIDEIKNDLREIQKISKQRTDRFLKAVDNLQGIMATDTILRKTKKKQADAKNIVHIIQKLKQNLKVLMKSKVRF